MDTVDLPPSDANPAERLARLKGLVDSCRESANRHGERFNIFSILRAQRDETGTHSRFLAEMLDPAGRHGEGKQFLQAFIDGPLGRSVSISGPVTVKRELQTKKGRRIDIMIETPELVIGIEVKIDAQDQCGQLRDYHEELERRAGPAQSIVLAYLTLDGSPPSDASLAGLSTKQVVQRSFADSIRTWVATCSAESAHKPELSHALTQYRRVVENLTGYGGSVKAMIGERLATNSDDLRTALEIERSLPQAKSSVMLQFWREISARLESALGESPEIYGSKSLESLSYDFFHKRSNARHAGIKFPICQVGPDTVCLYVHIYSAIHYGLRIDDPSGQPVARREAREWFRRKVDDGNAIANRRDEWLICYYFDPASTDERVTLDFGEFDESVIALLENDRREVIIDHMVKHQMRLVELARSLWGPDHA